MDIIGKRRIFLNASLLLVALSAIVLVSPGLNLGIDFTSGSTVTFRFESSDPGTAGVKAALDRADHPEAIVQAMGDNQYFVRTDDLGNSGLDAITDEVAKLDGVPATVLDTSTVGSSVAQDTVRNAVIAGKTVLNSRCTYCHFISLLLLLLFYFFLVFLVLG